MFDIKETNDKFIDIDINSANIDLDKTIKYNNLKNVGAIIPVLFGGNPTDIKKLHVLRKKNIKIIEDAAHALGSSYKCGSKIGSQVLTRAIRRVNQLPKSSTSSSQGHRKHLGNNSVAWM